MYCSKCGNMLTPDTKFCPACGNAINSEPANNTPINNETTLPFQNIAGKIIVERKQAFKGAIIPFDVIVDNNFLGSVTSGTSVETIVPIGTHQITLRSPEKDVFQEVILTEQNKNVKVFVEAKFGLLTAKAYVSNVTYF